MKENFKQLGHFVGNTPVIAIRYKMGSAREKQVYCKCEQYSLPGSIKDRVALHLLQSAYKQELLKPGDRIIEASIGNMGISLAAFGKMLGHQVTIVMPEAEGPERMNVMTSLGAEVITVTTGPGDIRQAIALTRELATEDVEVFLPKQFESNATVQAHEKSTAREIWEQLGAKGLKADAFVAGIGTGGTIMGVGNYLKMKNPYLQVHPVLPLSKKEQPHRIEGMIEAFTPAIVQMDKLQEAVYVEDGDAILMAQRLGRQLGLGVGVSSGANVIAAMLAQSYLGDDAVVVTVLPDSNKNYLTSSLARIESLEAHYVSAKVNLLGFSPL